MRVLNVEVSNKISADTDNDQHDDREEATRRAVNIFKETNKEEFTEVTDHKKTQF